jgi:hypothetical protein
MGISSDAQEAQPVTGHAGDAPILGRARKASRATIAAGQRTSPGSGHPHERPTSLAILLKFIEAHEARQAARGAGRRRCNWFERHTLASMRWNHSLRRTSGSSASGEISATRRDPPRGRVRQIGRPCAESSRLDDFDPDDRTFDRPAAPRWGSAALNCALVRIEAAQIVGESRNRRAADGQSMGSRDIWAPA